MGNINESKLISEGAARMIQRMLLLYVYPEISEFAKLKGLGRMVLLCYKISIGYEA